MILRDGAIARPAGSFYSGGPDGGHYLLVKPLPPSMVPLAVGDVLWVELLLAWDDDGQGYLDYQGQALFVPPKGWPETTPRPDPDFIARTGWFWGRTIQFKMPGTEAIAELVYLEPLVHETAPAL